MWTICRNTCRESFCPRQKMTLSRKWVKNDVSYNLIKYLNYLATSYQHEFNWIRIDCKITRWLLLWRDMNNIFRSICIECWGSNWFCIGEDFNIGTFHIHRLLISFGDLKFLNFGRHFRDINWIVGFGFVLWLCSAYCFINLNHRFSS